MIFNYLWEIFFVDANFSRFHTASAEDCLLAQFIGGLLWRKPTLKLDESEARSDPQQSLQITSVPTFNQTKSTG
jgi:hypothetical protein